MKNKIFKTFTLIFCCFILGGGVATAQNKQNKSKEGKPVQFSGLIVTEEFGQIRAVPYAYVWILDRKVGVVANERGFFSIVTETGETVEFSALGFAKSNFRIPDTLRDDRYSMIKILSQDTVLLPEAVIFPWPNRDYFRTEFLAMNVKDELQRRADDNVTAETLEKVRKATPISGIETSTMFLRNQAKSYYYYGQQPPMNIFNPQAWGQFFSAWKRGDFKRKE